MLSRIVSDRYLVPDRRFETLANRVASAIYPDKPTKRDVLRRELLHKKFFPAGNTLLAGIEPIRPNCTILPAVDEANIEHTIDRARNLWESRIGMGFSLNSLKDPVSALKELSNINNMIKFDHRPQRGNMATISALHPSVEEFIFAKSGRSEELYNFNTSVVIRTNDIREHPEEIDRVLSMIANAAWDGGDPGVIFMDRIVNALPYNHDTVSSFLGPIETLVPCGEQAMHPNETCTLGSINLASKDFWVHKGRNWEFNQQEFADTVLVAVNTLDTVQKKMDFAGDEELAETSRITRRIGLGLMGWSDAVARYRIPKEDEAVLIRTIGSILQHHAYLASHDIAMNEGEYVLTGTENRMRAHLTITCVPPTGGISLLAGNKGFALDPLPRELDDMDVQDQLASLKQWQPYFDNTISKTVSMREDATHTDVYNVFKEALNSNIKTLTVYRSGSRQLQPLGTSKKSLITCSGC